MRGKLTSWVGFAFSALALTAGFARAGDQPSATEYFSDPLVRRLAAAACRGDVADVKRLVRDGADVNAVGKDGFTPLAFSMYCASLKGFSALLDAGANPNASVPALPLSDGSMVALAARANDVRWLKEIAEHGGDLNVRAGENQRTPLYHAIESDSLENLRFLIENGADVNVEAHGKRTPLDYAAGLRRWDRVHLLLKSGADWRRANMHGKDLIDRLQEFRSIRAAMLDSPGYQAVLRWLRDDEVELPESLLETMQPDPGEPAENRTDPRGKDATDE